MTPEKKMKTLRNALYGICSENPSCDTCRFLDSDNERYDDCCCGIRDKHGNIPWHSNWKIEEAFGLEEPYKPVFPEAVEESMMKHFTRGE